MKKRPKRKRLKTQPREQTYVRFGLAVFFHRHQILGCTQAKLGAKVGKTRAAIANIEAGRQRIYLEDVFNFAKALGIEPITLLRASQGDPP